MRRELGICCWPLQKFTLQYIVDNHSDHLPPKHKEDILDLFVELSDDEIVDPCLIQEQVTWEIKYHRFWTNLNMGIC